MGTFDYDFDVHRILSEISSLILQKQIIAGKTLLVFDEIQECPKAITALKYFCENMRELHVICASSLLGVAVKRQNVSFPVGKIDRLQMYPMSFSEFLRTDGGEKYYSSLQNIDKSRALSDIYTVSMEKYLKNYYIVGGMPEAVQKWVATHDYQKVEKIQESILADYASDFSKRAPLSEVPKLGWIWDSIPKQLAKDNNKFMFSHVKEGKRAKDLEDALQWLVDAGLIYCPQMISQPEIPLSFAANATYFKVYMADIGLLRKKANVSYTTILEGDDRYTGFKGALTENYVQNELICLGIHPYFYRSGNSAEIDFIIEEKGRIIPIEVKSADNTRAKSMAGYVKKYEPEYAFKLSLKNVAENVSARGKMYSLPLYMVWRLREYMG